MRFKARLLKENTVFLHALTSSFQKLGTVGAFYLHPERVNINVISDNIDSPKCYAELDTKQMFMDYRIESQSDNAILFEISPLALLSDALGSGKSCDVCVLKLVKVNNRPYLRIEAQHSSTAQIGISQNIPIKVMRAVEISYYMPPQVSPPQVSLYLPRNKMFRTIVDKLNKFSKSMVIVGEQAGALALHISQVNINIKTIVSGLIPVLDMEGMEGEHEQRRIHKNKASIKVDTRKLSAVLNLTHLPWENSRLYLHENEPLYLETTTDRGLIGFYIPTQIMEDIEGT